MSKFDLIHAENRIYVFRLGSSIYYMDCRDRDLFKTYDSDLKRLSIIMPEGWLYNSTNGEVSILMLQYMADAYIRGYNNGYESKISSYFEDFLHRLKNIINTEKLKESFKNIFSIELSEYTEVKKKINSLISNVDLLNKHKTLSRNLLERSLKLAEINNDQLFITDIMKALKSLPSSEINFDSELRQIFDFKEDELPIIFSNVKKLLKNRH